MTKRKPKQVGSCGIYVFVDKGDGSCPLLLCHRRSQQITEAGTLAAPGGVVERAKCPVANGTLDFDAGARATAANELLEETGIRLDTIRVANLLQLPVSPEDAYWGPELHRNYYTVLNKFPVVGGPEASSKHEVEPFGTRGIGEDAGDGYHAWVSVEELLKRNDLMKGCRRPLEGFLEQRANANDDDDDIDESSGESRSSDDDGDRSPESVGSDVSRRRDSSSSQQLRALPPLRLRGSLAAAAMAGRSTVRLTPRDDVRLPNSLPLTHDYCDVPVEKKMRYSFRESEDAADACVSTTSFSKINLDRWSVMPRVAVFDLDETCWKGSLDGKPFKVPPFSWCPAIRTVVDSANTPVLVFPDVPGMLLALHHRGVCLAVASHNTRKDWCCQVMDNFVLDESTGLTWGSLVPPEMRVVTCAHTHWPDKDAHLKDICKNFRDGPLNYRDMIFFDDGRKICQKACRLEVSAVRCPEGLRESHLHEALEFISRRGSA